MHPTLSEHKQNFDGTIDHLHKELSQLRTGRATPALVEDLPVEAYGVMTPIKGVASIAVQDAKTLTIQPWDKNMLKPIEKAILASNIGISPTVDGTLVRITMPQMTEENRKHLVKVMKEKLEDAKIRLRSAREKVRDQALAMEKDKKIAEDEKFKILEELDKMTKEYTGNIDKIGEEKEKEIMTI